MSSFTCEHCGTDIIDTPSGYITECDHYPSYHLSQNERAQIIKLALDLRDLLFDDANGMTQGAMVGCPVECISFAKGWIQRAKGVDVSVKGVFAEDDK